MRDQRLTQLARLSKQAVRTYAQAPGLFSVSRFDPHSATEYLIAFNTSDKPLRAASVIGSSGLNLESLFGNCPAQTGVPGSVMLDIPAFGSIVCRIAPSPENIVR